MAISGDRRDAQGLPLFVPERWGREKSGRFFESDEHGGESAGKGNHPAPNLIRSAAPGVITAKLDQLAALGRANSLWTLTFGLACCAIEMISTHMAHHDFDRFGIVTWPSPRQSDVMIVAGTVVKKMADPIRLLYEQMPDPKWVIAMGTCATSGGPYYKSYSVVMARHLPPIQDLQQKLIDIQSKAVVPIEDLKQINKKMNQGEKASRRRSATAAFHASSSR